VSANPSAKPGFLGLQAKISRNASVYAGWTQVLPTIRAALGFRVKKRLVVNERYGDVSPVGTCDDATNVGQQVVAFLA